MIKNTLKQSKFEDKTVKFTQPSLVLIGLHDFLIFSNRTAHAWSVEVGNRLRETDVPSQSFSPKSAVKYLHVGRRKIQISPPPGRTRSVKYPTPGPGLLYVRGLKEYLCMYVARDFSRYPLGPPPGPSCSKGG